MVGENLELHVEVYLRKKIFSKKFISIQDLNKA
jgi:hypothetical protein